MRALLERLARFVIAIGFTIMPACDITAASASAADVQAAINAASNGQVVCIPAGTATWSQDVTVGTSDADANTKGITLAGASGGATVITIASGHRLKIYTHSTHRFRLTGIKFLDNPAFGSEGAVVINSDAGDATWRIDHCIWEVGASAGDCQVTHSGAAAGLFDHNTVHVQTTGIEFFHNRAYNAGDNTGWNVDVTPGSADAVYFEDNDFWHERADGCGSGVHEGSAVQNYNGARFVFRHNTVRFFNVDIHGTAGAVGGRWLEVYDNEWIVDDPPVPNQAQAINVRAGSGVVYNNVCTVVGSPCFDQKPNIQLIEDNTTGTWPLAYQIGSGYGGHTDNHASCAGGTVNQSPLYLWNNDANFGTPGGDAYVHANRDFFVSGSQPSPMKIWQKSTDDCSSTYDYVPYTYPHPLAADDGLAGSGALVLGASATLRGTGALGGAGSIQLPAAGVLRGAGALAASGTLALSGAGTLTIDELSGTAALHLTPAGALSGTGALAGAGAMLLNAGGELVDASEEEQPQIALGGRSLRARPRAVPAVPLSGGRIAQASGVAAMQLHAEATLDGIGALAGSVSRLFGAGASTLEDTEEEMVALLLAAWS